ncbi:unnamed protein product [Diatraea saccharalis]|uniref:Uncharacterized protein n=1 Tax=Diatraea saccharalis TaxID=40085 RepID=A0A9N9WA52_9NEOP|nr:unnamed protein product [Diatraea saccharalis]
MIFADGCSHLEARVGPPPLNLPLVLRCHVSSSLCVVLLTGGGYRSRGGGDSSLERLVECVRLGVESGGGGVRVRAVLALLHAHALPRAHQHAPDLARAAHRLLASVLIHRWRYFFTAKCEGEESARRLNELREALSALGRSLLQPDIELLRINIETLDALNSKWKLYHKVNYCDTVYGPCLMSRTVRLIQRIQNACARFCFHVPPRTHVTPFLNTANLLKMEARRKLHLATLLYGVIETKRPSYLYDKLTIFRNEFLSEFLSVLLASLSEGGARALLRDEVVAAVHSMAAVDFHTFRAAFLPHFLASLPGLAPHHREMLADFPPDTDLPTFTQNIQKLMNDVNCYRAYNALSPPGMSG